MIPRLGLFPNIKIRGGPGSIPRLPQLFRFLLLFFGRSLLKPQCPRELNNVYYLIELNYKYFY